MFLPLGDTPNPRGTPWVTWSLMALNIGIYLLVTLPLSLRPADLADPALELYLSVVRERVPAGVSLQAVLARVSAYDLFVFSHGYRPVDPAFGDLISSMFLHGGFLHLAGNMLFLWIYGDNVEHRLGRIPYLAAYLATGAAATLFHAAFNSDSPLPLVGASGAISGVLGFYFLWFPHNQVRLLVALFPFLVDVILVPARLVLGFYLLIDNLLPFLVSQGGGGGGVAHGAHIGGFLGGLLWARLVEVRDRGRRPAEYATPRAGRTPGGPAEEVAGALRRGEFEDAARRYFMAADEELLARRLQPTDSLALADWLAQNGHPRAALQVYRRQLRHHPREPGAAEAHLGAGWVHLRDLGAPVPAWQHFLDALDLDPHPDTAAAARAGLAAIEQGRGRRRP